VDTVSRFTVLWGGPGHPLRFDLSLSENGLEVGGSYEALPRRI